MGQAVLSAAFVGCLSSSAVGQPAAGRASNRDLSLGRAVAPSVLSNTRGVTRTRAETQSPPGMMRHAPRTSRWAYRMLVSVGLGALGFIAGGYTGPGLEGDCVCDSPGMKGFLIGAPIGAAVGATVGVFITD